MPEAQHISGENFVIKTKQYLEATLTIEVAWTVYDNTGMTCLTDLNGNPHTFDLLAILKEDGKIPIYVEAKERTMPSDINTQFDDFIRVSFSCYVAGRRGSSQWNPYFMFAASRPFKSTDYHLLTSPDYLMDMLQSARSYGITAVTNRDLNDFTSRLWFVIWSNKQHLMTVSDPRLYARVGLRGVSSHDPAV